MRAWLLVCLMLVAAKAAAQSGGGVGVQDIFGRSLNSSNGIVLIDWDGHMANPLLKFVVIPPSGASYPGTLTLRASGDRLYFDNPGSIGTTGPTKSLSVSSASSRPTFRLAVFPDREGLDESYSLTLVFVGANNVRQTNTLPITVRDLDRSRASDFLVTLNFDRDATPFFSNPTARVIAEQAAADWAYFFGEMNLNLVWPGTESTYIWSNNYNGGYYFSNTNTYRGYLLYAYGTTNTLHRSGGEGSYSGGLQQSGTTNLTLKRSGGFSAEIHGNYNTLGWLYLTNDRDWQVTGNLGHETNDFYSIAHHEIGHALMFNRAHPGFETAYLAGSFRQPEITNYYGGPVPIDASHHFQGVIDPESGQGAFGYEYYGQIPRRRWLITKLDLLCARAVGYAVRTNSALLPLALHSSNALPSAALWLPYQHTLIATGGIPVYHWEITAGSLPPGLTLDSFTGVLEGRPLASGNFQWTTRLREYREGSPGITRDFSLPVGSPPPVSLRMENFDDLSDSNATLWVQGAMGQRQVVETSTNLFDWTALITNQSGTNPFEVNIPFRPERPHQYFRARVVP